MKRYSLYRWPDSQEFIGREDCVLVMPPQGSEVELDSAYMVPEPDGDYVLLDWPERQGLEDAPGSLSSYEGDLFVPVDVYATDAA